MPNVTPERLRITCVEVLAGLVASGAYADAEAVNQGYCGDFADDVYAALSLKGHKPHEDLRQLGIEGFLVPDEDEVEPPRFDRDLVERHWPAMLPPEGLDWDAMDAMASDADLSPGTHTWILLDGLHYDAEAPGGGCATRSTCPSSGGWSRGGSSNTSTGDPGREGAPHVARGLPAPGQGRRSPSVAAFPARFQGMPRIATPGKRASAIQFRPGQRRKWKWITPP